MKRIKLPVADIVELYGSGWSSAKIGARYGVDESVVVRHLREADVAIRSPGRRQVLLDLDLSGQRAGRLIVKTRDPERKAHWICLCDCGRRTTARADHLIHARTRSCGCLLTESRYTANLKHGAAVDGKITKEYRAWSAAKNRCTNPSNNRYASYGARGIRMCDEWTNDFGAFFRDMGPCPLGYSLDRIDVDGYYEPKNCRWASDAQQHNNRRDSRYVEIDGQKLTITQASKKVGLPKALVFTRLYRGWPVERALELQI